jgi:hypothetical protein
MDILFAEQQITYVAIEPAAAANDRDDWVHPIGWAYDKIAGCQ